MAGATQIGTGAVVLTANADALLTGLANAKAQTNRWAADTTRAAQIKTGGVKGGGGGGGGGVTDMLPFLKAGALLTGGLALAKPLVAKIGESFMSWVTGIKSAAMELDKMRGMASEFEANIDRRLAKEAEWVSAAATPEDKLKAIGAQIAMNKKELVGMIATQKMWEAEVEKLSDVWTEDPEAMLLFLGGGLEDQLEKVKVELASATNGVNKYKDALAKLEEQKGRITRPETDPALVGDIGRLREQWEQQVDAATRGLTPIQQSIEALRRRGATEAMLAELTKSGEKLDMANMKPQSAGAMLRGSQEAGSIMAKFETANLLRPAPPPVADMPVLISKATLKEAKEQKALLFRILGAVSSGTPILVVE